MEMNTLPAGTFKLTGVCVYILKALVAQIQWFILQELLDLNKYLNLG